MKKLIWTAGIGLILIITTALLYYKYTSSQETQILDEAESFIESEEFAIESTEETILETEGGLVIAIPENAFVDENGNAVTGKVDINIKEALTPESILKSGLSTTSNGEALETGGMFFIEALQNGKPLHISSGKEIMAEVPTEKIKDGMQLFQGEKLKDGSINWVDPKPIEKFLSPLEITTLDFYPPGYEDSLATLGFGEKNKKFKDSLFYTFFCKAPETKPTVISIVEDTYEGAIVSEHDSLPPVYWKTKTLDLGNNKYRRQLTAEIPVGFKMFAMDCSDQGATPLSIQFKTSSNIEFIGELVSPNTKSFFHPQTNRNLTYYEGNAIFYQDFKCLDEATNQLNYEIHHMLFDDIEYYASQYYYGNSSLPNENDSKSADNVAGESEYECKGIRPSDIRTIWNSKFNNTNLATKEFEERLHEIYKSCNRKILDIYLDNLESPLYYSDSLAMVISENSEAFSEFYGRRNGRVQIGNKLAESLDKYYAEKSKTYEEVARKTQRDFWAKQSELDKEALLKTQQNNLANSKRIQENFQKEFALNMKETCKQLKNCRTSNARPSHNRYRMPMSTLGWKNVDRFVFESTMNRTSMNYTDPQTGRKAEIEYEPVTVKISELDQFDRVYVYLVGNKQASFMRMKRKNGEFYGKLNGFIKYNIICIGYKNKSIYVAETSPAEPKKYDFVLNQISEKKLDKLIRKLTHSKSEKDILNDLNFEKFKKTDALRKQNNRKTFKIRARLRPVIFPCEKEVLWFSN